MATFREIIYMALDLLKETNDDAFYTEEHILFLASKYRAALIERKQRMSRNSAFQEMSLQNKQVVCMNLEQTNLLSNGCGETVLKSTEKLPKFLPGGNANIHVTSDIIFSNVTMIPVERMPYVGHNKWLQNIIYAAISGDGYLYLTSNNNQFLFLESVKVDGVFADPVEAAKLSCDSDGASECNYLDTTFPLEDDLIPSCIEMVVQEIAGPRYNPEDKTNNATDDLSDVGMVNRRVATPNEDRIRQEQQTSE